MLIRNSNSIDNKPVNFNGATRTLRHNYFANFQEIADVFEKHPNCDGIAGSLPFSWIERIRNMPKDEKRHRIKQVYQLFRDVFSQAYPDQMSKKDLQAVSLKFSEVLRNVGIIPQENQIVIKKRKVYGSFIRGAFTIKERGKNKCLEPLFIKQLPDLSKYKSIRNHESEKGEIEEFFKKLMLISNDFTDIRKILAKYGFKHHDFHDSNVFIAKNKKNKLIIRLNDLGRIKQASPEELKQEKFITYNHKTKTFE